MRNSFGWIKNAWNYFQKTNLPFSPQESNTGSAHAWKRLKFKTWNPFLFFIAFISDRLQQTWNPEVLQHILNSLTSFPALPDHELEAIVTAGEVGYVREAVRYVLQSICHGMAWHKYNSVAAAHTWHSHSGILELPPSPLHPPHQQHSQAGE